MTKRSKIKELFTNKKIIILLIVLIISLIAISPFPRDGVSIRNVDKDSYAADQIIVEQGKPLSKERIIRIDDQEIKNSIDYYNYVDKLEANTTVKIETNRDVYRIRTNDIGELGLSIVDTPPSNIQKGLDLEGGTRVLLQPLEEVPNEVLDEAAESLKIRLNAFGLSNVVVRQVTTPTQYIIVELAGSTKEEVKELLLQQGKFEAIILNTTVITGKDIERVGKSAQDARISACSQYTPDEFRCGFDFTLQISRVAAEKFAAKTKELDVIGDSLSAPINLYLDDVLISNLSISAGLRGSITTRISISGGENGATEREAKENTRAEMKKLQTILQSGSLPIKLEIAEAETISPALGKEFTENAIQVGLLAILTVAVVVFIAYRKLKIALPMLVTMFSEVFILLGVAALVQWQLDLAAIAGIIIAAGTGVDDQIVITSEILKGDKASHNWKEKIKKAFFIIMGAYLTTIVATIPLAWAGAGLLKGFAFATIVGVTIGVFITRPAFAAILEVLMKD